MKLANHSLAQRGVTLIEVLVTIVILSIGLLSMAAMMAYSTLLPKFSGNRSVAISVGTNMIERMRANPSTWNNATSTLSFSITSYNTATFTTTFVASSSLPSGSTCAFPNCTTTTMAIMDLAQITQQLNQQLTPAGITIAVTDDANNEGNLWIIWQEASSFGSFNTAGSDNCPVAVTTLALSPPPRCVYLPFKL